MPTQEAKAHHVGEWASLRNTSPEIAEAIFEVAGYDEKMAEKIWEEGSDEVLVKAFAKTDKDSLFWGEQTIERINQRLPRFSRGSFLLFHRFIQHAIKLIHRAETISVYRATA